MKELGKGGYGTVHLARRFSDGKNFAIKKYRDSRAKMWEAELRSNESEFKNLKSLNHPFIIKVEEFYDD
jgi:serine/threonine protein kinase